METRRWVNQSQPQTLVIAVFLLYINAVFTLLLGSDSDAFVFLGLVKLGVGELDSNLLEQLITIVLGVGMAVAGFFIANERKWGYWLGVVLAALPLVGALILMIVPARNLVPRVSLADLGLISLLFDVALFALLVHPQSRDYQRIWFKK